MLRFLKNLFTTIHTPYVTKPGHYLNVPYYDNYGRIVEYNSMIFMGRNPDTNQYIFIKEGRRFELPQEAMYDEKTLKDHLFILGI